MEVANKQSSDKDTENDDKKSVPFWWEMAMFRLLNAVMVIFFLTATIKLQGYC